MSIIPKLASSLNRRDELPNQKLAKDIVTKNDKIAVKELIDNLTNKNKNIQHDSIKVLYEIGEIKPDLIANYVNVFVDLLIHKNNRLQWGAMTALYTIVLENPKAIYNSLTKIIEASHKGSVITKDYTVKILIQLCKIKKYSENAFLLLNEQLMNAPTNQLPMYAENAFLIINNENKNIFIKTVTARLNDIEKDTKRKRVEKIIKKIIESN